MTTDKGQSGSPILKLDKNGRRAIIGIHIENYGEVNRALRLTQKKLATIRKWSKIIKI